MGNIWSFDVDKELIFPRATLDGTAFNLEQVDRVPGKRLKKGEESTWTMGKAHSERSLASGGG